MVDMVLFLYLAMVVLQLFDVWTTEQVLRYGGDEDNEFLKNLFVNFGVRATLLTTKIAMLLFLGSLTFYKHIFDAEWTMLAVFDVFYLIIVVQNFHVLKEQKAWKLSQKG